MTQTVIYNRVIKMDNGRGKVETLTFSNSQDGNRRQIIERDIDGTDADVALNVTVDVSLLKAIAVRFIPDVETVTASISVFTNVVDPGTDTFDVSRLKPFYWNDQSGIALPFTVDITQLFVDGAGGGGKDGKIIVDILEAIVTP